MSFLQKLTHNQNIHKPKHVINRKEKQDSLKEIQVPKNLFISRERASVFTSQGSITLEAAIVVPLFFYAILCVAYLMEMMAIQTTMRNALYSAGKQLAEKMYLEAVVTTDEIEQNIIENVGVEKLEDSMIVGGSGGINCSDSVINRSTGELNLRLQYQVDIPFVIFQIAPILQEESLRVKGWTGYVSGVENISNTNIVYVAETGLVYHKDSECTYLDLSIRQVSVPSLENLRNQNGGKYFACEFCSKKNTGKWHCYITDYGTRYHMSLECKKIQRNVYAIPIDEAYGLGGCSKCVK